MKQIYELFEVKINNLSSTPETRSYILGVFSNIKSPDLSNNSITLKFSEAKFSYKFEKFQELADWLLFCQTFFPEHLQYTSKDYINAIAQNSYYYCYKLINKQWKCFEELADRFPEITNNLQSSLHTKKVIF